MKLMQSSSVGIIGGADGPTTIFLMGNPIQIVVGGLLVLAVLTAALCWLRRK